MGHTAFEIFNFIENLPIKVESLAVWGETLFVGTNDGVLLVYNIQYQKTNDKSKRFTYTLNNNLTKKGFAKKSISQLCAIPELGMLVSLADSVIRIHTLASLREVSTFQKQGSPVKGIQSFALKKEQGEFSMVVSMKASFAGTLMIATYDVKEMVFKFQQELVIPESAKSLCWSGKTICVGFKREYSIINTSGAAPKSLFATGNNQLNTICLAVPGEILLTRDNVLVSLNNEGKPVRSHGISWSEHPSCLAFIEPFLIGPVGMFVEIRILSNALKKETLVQTITVVGVSKISQPNFIDLDAHSIDEGLGCSYKVKSEIDPDDDIYPEVRVFLAAKNNIHVLCMKQVHLQVQELQNRREYEHALALVDYFEGSPFQVEKWIVNSVHFDYALFLFAQGHFESAMEHFLKSGGDPRMIISLVPALLPKNSSKYPLVPFASNEEKKKLDKLLADPETLATAFNAFIPFLTAKRIPPGKDISGDEEIIAEAVDSALFKCFLFTSDEEYIYKFLDNPNRVNIPDIESTLVTLKRYKELIRLYKSKSLHQKALLLLKTLGESTAEDPSIKEFEGVRQIISYLKEMHEPKELILYYSKWVLQQQPIVGLKIFAHKATPFSIMEILNFFNTIEGGKIISMKIGYLEYLINIEKSEKPDLHDLLISHYLDYVLNDYKDEEYKVEDIGARLKEFLSASKYYHPEKMLSRFPFDSLLEERAILLSRINRHSQALKIYVQKLRRPDLAEKYCVQHYNTTNEESKEIFITLLSMLLEPGESGEIPDLKYCIKILEKHYDKVDVVKVIQKLPASISLQDLEKYFELVIRKNTDTRRNTQVMRNMARSEHLTVSESWITERRRKIKITSGRVCPVCKKKIGLSAFACYPNGVVTHYVCAKDQNLCPVSNKDFARESLQPLFISIAEKKIDFANNAI